VSNLRSASVCSGFIHSVWFFIDSQ
jgi:hypothetical protein